LEDGVDLHTHFAEIDTLVKQLTTPQFKLPDSFIMAVTLNSLPESYRTVVTILQMSEGITSEKLRLALLAHESSMRQSVSQSHKLLKAQGVPMGLAENMWLCSKDGTSGSITVGTT
jgi:translation elongation factor EF-4